MVKGETNLLSKFSYEIINEKTISRIGRVYTPLLNNHNVIGIDCHKLIRQNKEQLPSVVLR